jgi:hypothetical protein
VFTDKGINEGGFCGNIVLGGARLGEFCIIASFSAT